jgi:hypothetical protein
MGAVHFFAKGGDGRIREKDQQRREGNESQEEQTGTQCADATGERRIARRAGDDAVAQGASQSHLARDRRGGG